MKNNISIQILRSFSKNDLKDFEDFINSTYHNSNKKITILFGVIKNSFKAQNDNLLERESLFKKLYAGKEFNNQILKNLFSEFHKLIRQYLAIKHIDRNLPQQNLFFINELLERNALQIAERYINEELAKLDDKEIRSETHFEDKLNLLNAIDLIQVNYDSFAKKPEIFISRGNYLILIFFIKLFEDLNDNLLIAENFKSEADVNPLMNFLKFIDLNGYIEFIQNRYPEISDLISIYYTMYLSRVDKEDESHFYKMKELIYKNVERLNDHTKYNFWIFLQNAVYSNYGLKNIKFNKELFEINKFFLKFNLYDSIFKGYIPGMAYINIVTNANIAEEYEWAEGFITEYAEKIEPATRENFVNIAKVMIYFSLKKYDEALEANSKIKTESITEKINIRFYNLMIYFELGHFDSAVNELETLRKYINSLKEKGKLPSYTEDITLRGIKHFSRLINAAAGNKKLDYAYFVEAEKDKSFRFKKWVWNKMDRMVNQ
ncbi:MAG TPA: hypothetical protein PLG90_11215 [Ignavibacteria bacterium]|nr:hypothetical protein [Ignavibacteria bacterium]